MKRMVLGVVCFLAGSCLVNAADVKLPEGYKIIESTLPYTMVLTPYTTYPVLLQKYVPVNLFEGKWGSKPGEFGLRYTEVADENRPTSLAINSKNEIYVLDMVNNRIQKFTPEGRYIKSISVRSFCGKEGVRPSETSWSHSPYYVGVAVEIDSKDNLYYHCYKGETWPEKKAEVWEFQDDVLVKKWDAPPSGEFVISPKDELVKILYNKKSKRTEQFNIREQSSEEWFENKISLSWLDISFEEDIRKRTVPANLIMKNPLDQTIVIRCEYSPTTIFPEVWISREIHLWQDTFVVYHSWANKTEKIAFFDQFDLRGKFLSTIIMPNNIDSPREKYDKTGNIYELVKTNHGMTIKKWILKK